MDKTLQLLATARTFVVNYQIIFPLFDQIIFHPANELEGLTKTLQMEQIARTAMTTYLEYLCFTH